MMNRKQQADERVNILKETKKTMALLASTTNKSSYLHKSVASEMFETILKDDSWRLEGGPALTQLLSDIDSLGKTVRCREYQLLPFRHAHIQT